jgi:hypothetical protein
MGTTWHSMWWSLVLAYQPAVRGSCDGSTARMFGEAAMAKPWDGVGTTAMVGTHKAQEGGFWVSAMLTLAVKPKWVSYKLDETIEQPGSDFPSKHHGSV